MRNLFKNFIANESGATAIEYGLIVGLIFLVIVGAVSLFASKSTGTFDKISTAVSSATG
jgi:pilus assembly protein Flp/PilA